MTVRLGVDFGTSTTVAMLSRRPGQVMPLLFDGSPLLPSAVYAAETGDLVVGQDAWRSARIAPARFEPNPKQRIDEGSVLLGEREVPVTDLVGAVLARVAAEAARVGGGVDELTMTFPGAWGGPRRAVLAGAACMAGLPSPRLVPEPVAAAAYFSTSSAAVLRPDACAVVFDFGAGTFDATVVRRGPTGFDVLATTGLDDAGGLDVDAAVLAYLGEVFGQRDPAAWQRITDPRIEADRRGRRQLWDDVRGAKEMLSRVSSTFVPLPALSVDAPLGREKLEELARPLLDRTVRATVAVIERVRVPVDAVLLVGGSSRMPAVATALHRATGIAPTMIEWPELVVAQGALSTMSGDDPGPASRVPDPPQAAGSATTPSGPALVDVGGPAFRPDDDVDTAAKAAVTFPVPRVRQGADAFVDLGLGRGQMVRGGQEHIWLDTAVRCRSCSGSGCVPGTRPQPCPGCRGGGTIRPNVPCPFCAGTGAVIADPCGTCEGDGRIEVRRKVSVKIPAGVKPGTRFRFPAQGEVGPGGGPNGDLFVVVVHSDEAHRVGPVIAPVQPAGPARKSRRRVRWPRLGRPRRPPTRRGSLLVLLLSNAVVTGLTMLAFAILVGPGQTRFVEMAAAVAGMLGVVASVATVARRHEGWLGKAVAFLSPLVVVCCAAAQYVPHFGLRFAGLGGGLFLLAATIVGLTGAGPSRLLNPPMPTLFVAPGGFCGVAAALGASYLTAETLANLVAVAVVGVVAGLDHASTVRMARWRVRPVRALAGHALFCAVLATSGVFLPDVAAGLAIGVLLVTLGLVVAMLGRWAKALQAWLRW